MASAVALAVFLVLALPLSVGGLTLCLPGALRGTDSFRLTSAVALARGALVLAQALAASPPVRVRGAAVALTGRVALFLAGTVPSATPEALRLGREG